MDEESPAWADVDVRTYRDRMKWFWQSPSTNSPANGFTYGLPFRPMLNLLHYYGPCALHGPVIIMDCEAYKLPESGSVRGGKRFVNILSRGC